MRRFHFPALRFVADLRQRELNLPVDLQSVLLVAGMALCWLTPNHFMPWLSFDADFGMSVVLTLLAFAVWIGEKSAWKVPRPAFFALAAALVPPVQFYAGLIYFAGDAWLFSGGLFGFSLAIALGSTLGQRRQGFLTDSVLTAALCASVASVGIQLWQWLRLSGFSEFSGLGLWLLNMPAGFRPSANLGQPNQLSTLLLWGLTGVWWAFMRRRIAGGTAVFAAAYLLFGLAMTQSRSGWGGLIVMATVAWTCRRPLGSIRYRSVLAALLVYFIFITVLWSTLNEAFYMSAAESMGNRLSVGARALNWKVCLAAIAQRPWFGFGWGQVAVAQQSALLSQPASGEYFAYAHDLVLDLLLWNGLPLGGLMALSFGLWLVGRFRRVVSAEGAVLSMAIGAFLVHALLEYPHAYFYFLLPVGLMLGALSAVTADRVPVFVPRAVVAAALAAAAILLAWIAHDYAKAAENMEQLRFESARIGTSRHSEPPDIALLTQLREYLGTLRVNVHRPVEAATLRSLQMTAERYASDSSLFRYAMSAAVSGRPDLAVPALRRLCQLHAADNCRDVRTAWMDEARLRHPEMKAVLEEAEREAGRRPR
jgi:O-antigen ligase